MAVANSKTLRSYITRNKEKGTDAERNKDARGEGGHGDIGWRQKKESRQCFGMSHRARYFFPMTLYGGIDR